MIRRALFIEVSVVCHIAFGFVWVWGFGLRVEGLGFRV